MPKRTQNLKMCRLKQDYLSQKLATELDAQFEAHLAGCPACREEVAFWQQAHPAIDSWKNQVTAAPITQGDVYKLVSDVAPGKTTWRTVLRPVLALGATGVVALAVAWVVGFGPLFDSGNGSSPRIDQVKSPASTPAVATSEVNVLQIFETGPEEQLHEEIDADTIGLAPRTRLALVRKNNRQTRFRLEMGTAAFEVSKREQGQSFVVGVTQYLVEVVGTQFSVSKPKEGGVSVVVNEGIVMVRGPRQSWRLTAGERLNLAAKAEGAKSDATPEELAQITTMVKQTPETAPAPTAARPAPRPSPVEENKASGMAAREDDGPVDLKSLKHLLARGDAAAALAGAKALVDNNPNDGSAWMLLADSHRKLSSWNDAVAAYEKAAALSSGSQKHRAQYQAATIYQQKLGNHERAIPLFQQYLRAPSAPVSLKDVAKLNLAKSLIQVGQKPDARALLQEVVASQNDSYVGKNAQQLLTQNQ